MPIYSHHMRTRCVHAHILPEYCILRRAGEGLGVAFLSALTRARACVQRPRKMKFHVQSRGRANNNAQPERKHKDRRGKNIRAFLRIRRVIFHASAGTSRATLFSRSDSRVRGLVYNIHVYIYTWMAFTRGLWGFFRPPPMVMEFL